MTEPGNGSDLKSRFTRRSFLKGSGAVAAATALHGQQADGQQDETPQVISGTTTMTLKVNSKSHQVKVEPRDTLLDVLRYQLDLTGAKPVSGDGTSGASTVLIDGKPAMASTVLAVTCRDKSIETVEAQGIDKPDEIAKAFVKHDASQCGFCTPGFVVAIRAVLAKNPNATEDEIRASLNGNICRCGTYANIIRAIADVAKGGGNG